MKSIKLGKMTMKYREYYTQIQALDGFDDVERKNLLLFAFDAEKDDNDIKSKMGQKKFTRFPITEIWKVELLLNSNRYAYKWQPKIIHIKPFLTAKWRVKFSLWRRVKKEFICLSLLFAES